MALHAQYSAKSFDHSSDHPSISSDSHSYDIIDNDVDYSFETQTSQELDSQGSAQEPLCVHVERIVRDYFTLLGDDIPTDLYNLILKEVERPLLAVVLEQTRGNQTKCAQILGLNRGTLRKKLKTYDLM